MSEKQSPFVSRLNAGEDPVDLLYELSAEELTRIVYSDGPATVSVPFPLLEAILTKLGRQLPDDPPAR